MSFLNLQKDMILLMLLEHPGSKLLVCVTLVSGEQYSAFVARGETSKTPLTRLLLQSSATHSCATQSSATQLCYTVQLHNVSQMGGGPTTLTCFMPNLNLSSKQMLVICVTQFTGVDRSHFTGNTIYSQTIFNLP